MYEEHFGLSKNPFQSVAEGEAVFEGSEQKKVISGLKTALATNDSIAVVTGPVGVGKTTIVQRAIEEVAPDRLVARLGRAAVGSDELVDLLLAQFGVVREPTRRFECLKTFNRILDEHAESGARVFIVIEDAERLGEELLEELEALTASDGGACAGANIILMGPQKLDKLIAKPSLERLRQRIRLQKTLDRFNAEEVEAYLRHRLQAAGGDYNAIFEPGSALMVRRCSGGIPRVINGLCETALNETAENHLNQVTAKIVFRVAVDVFGMAPGDTPGHTQTAPPAPQPTPPVIKPQPPPEKTPAPAAKAPAPENAPPEQSPEPVAMPATAAKPEPSAPKVNALVDKPAAATRKADPTIPVAKAAATAAPEPKPQAPMPPRAPRLPAGVNGASGAAATAATLKATSGTAASRPLPDLPPKFKFADEIVVDKDTKPKIPAETGRDGLPDLARLEPEQDAAKIADENRAAKDAATPAAEDIPTLGDSARVEAVAAPPAKPAPAAPKPTAQPQAAAAKPRAPAAKPQSPAAAGPEPPVAKPKAPAAASPERRVAKPAAAKRRPQVDEPTASFVQVDHDMLDAALASLAVHDAEDGPPPEALALHEPTPEPAVEAPEVIPEVTLDKNIAAERPKTDPAELDRMAEELEQTKSLEEMSDKLAETLFGSEELEAISLQIREDVAPEENAVALETTESAGTVPEPARETATAPAEPATPVVPRPPATAAPAPRPPSAPAAPAAPAARPPATPDANVKLSGAAAAAQSPPETRVPQPEPIENQFNTSMTATLKSLNKRDLPPAVLDDEDTGEKPSGLLGRLKNTFKS